MLDDQLTIDDDILHDRHHISLSLLSHKFLGWVYWWNCNSPIRWAPYSHTFYLKLFELWYFWPELCQILETLFSYTYSCTFFDFIWRLNTHIGLISKHLSKIKLHQICYMHCIMILTKHLSLGSQICMFCKLITFILIYILSSSQSSPHGHAQGNLHWLQSLTCACFQPWSELFFAMNSEVN